LPTSSIRTVLTEIKWGDEVINHIKDGDKCYNNRLWHPALVSYIHAFEWSAISYLAYAENFDVIDEERRGNYYNFAGGQNNLLDKLTEHVDIDQKTISRLRGMNQAERRWMAHHKSGKVLQDDVDALRSRLKAFIELLYSPLIDEFTEDGESDLDLDASELQEDDDG
jgi:hypothetical protein